jgi:cytochrome P450
VSGAPQKNRDSVEVTTHSVAGDEGDGMALTMSQDVYYDPYDTALCNDPYPAFRRLRDEAPLYHNEQYDFFALSRFDDVEAALIDRETFQSGRGVILEMIQQNVEIPPGTLIHDEGRIHTIHRSLLSRVFTPKSMLAIEPQVREFCVRKLDELADRDRFDWVKDYAEYIPMQVFGMLLGIPEEDREAVRLQAEEGMHAEPGKPKEYSDDQMLGEFYGDYVDYRYQHPGDDVTSRLLFTEFEDADGVQRTLTRAEALVYLSVVAGAGNHTTNRLISWSAKVLADNPDARREIVADRSLIPNAIEETLRYEPSSTQIARSVGEDVELHGQTVPAGSAILLLAGSANRDERQFDDPDRYDIHRTIGHHLTFGYGSHFCLGAALARLEGRVALDEALNRFSAWELDHDNLQMGSLTGVRGYEALPVVVTERA